MAKKEEKKGWFERLIGPQVNSKKFRSFLMGLVSLVLTAAAAKFEFIDPEWSGKIADFIVYGIGAFMGLQGLSDVTSGGRTSSAYKEPTKK